jgi:hypothetical protein
MATSRGCTPCPRAAPGLAGLEAAEAAVTLSAFEDDNVGLNNKSAALLLASNSSWL